MEITLLNNYSIRNLDEMNWVLEIEKTRENKETKEKSQYKEIIGYYPTLDIALKDSIRYQIHNVKTKRELFEILDKLNALYNTIKNGI